MCLCSSSVYGEKREKSKPVFPPSNTTPGRELVSVAKKRRTSVVVAVQQRRPNSSQNPHAIDYMRRNLDKTLRRCLEGVLES